MKLCVDCKWYSKKWFSPFKKCLYEGEDRLVDNVDGDWRYILCDTQRNMSSEGFCGEDGCWWEAKE